MKNRILLLDGGGTQTLPISKSIYNKGNVVYIFYEHKLSYGFGTRYVSHKIQSPSIKNELDYTKFFMEFVKENSIEVVIPMSDPSAMFLSKNKEAFSKICKFFSPDYQSFMTGYDKNLLMTVCMDKGFPHPKTIDLQKTGVSNIEESLFPAILKPNLTTGGRGMKILSSRQELELVYERNIREFGNCHLQEFISSGGRQFKVELFLDQNQNLIASSVIHKQRYYPVSGGSSCCNVTVDNDSVVKVCFELAKEIGWIGFADFDLIEDPKDGVFKIMEINPRIPACIKSAVESGIDYGNLIVDYSLDRKPEHYQYVPGKQLRHLGFDILWFLQCKDRFRAKPNWFNFFQKGLSYQDISFKDPLPFILGTIGNASKIFSESFRKSKNKTLLTQ